MNKISFQSWHTSCGEPGCCDDYGTRLYINDSLVSESVEVQQEELDLILKALGVPFEFEEMDYEDNGASFGDYEERD